MSVDYLPALKAAASIENKNFSYTWRGRMYYTVNELPVDLRRETLPDLIYHLQDIKLIEPLNAKHLGCLIQGARKIETELNRRERIELQPETIPHESIIKVIKARADITDVLSRFTDVFVEKRTWTYRCTLHGPDKHPSGTIYKDTNRCWCFVCNQGGDVIKAVELFAKTDTRGAIKYLCQYCGIQPDILPAQPAPNPEHQKYTEALTQS